MNLYFKLLNIPVFSVSDVNKYYDNIGSARSAVRRLLKAGMIKKIRNDMYTCVDGENGGVVADRFQIGSSINEGSYISHHSAMEYYGITDQVFYDVYVTSSKRFTDFEFEGYRYHHIYPSIELGIEKQEYSGGVVVTDKERTVGNADIGNAKQELYNGYKGNQYNQVVCRYLNHRICRISLC